MKDNKKYNKYIWSFLEQGEEINEVFNLRKGCTCYFTNFRIIVIRRRPLSLRLYITDIDYEKISRVVCGKIFDWPLFFIGVVLIFVGLYYASLQWLLGFMGVTSIIIAFFVPVYSLSIYTKEKENIQFSGSRSEIDGLLKTIQYYMDEIN
jgi:hypothetical protein